MFGLASSLVIADLSLVTLTWSKEALMESSDGYRWLQICVENIQNHLLQPVLSRSLKDSTT